VLHPDTRAARTTALINVVATADRHGWDFAPVVFGLFDHADLRALEVDVTLTGPDMWDVPARPVGARTYPSPSSCVASPVT
jgi:hypothetical protein